MHQYRSGERSRAICEACGEVVPTTFAYRTVPFSDGTGEVERILAAACDRCGAVVAVPPQSLPAIQAARRRATRSLEVSLPAPYLENLDLAVWRLDDSATGDLRKRLVAWFILDLDDAADGRGRLAAALSAVPDWAESAATAPRRRLSMKISPLLDTAIGRLTERTGATRTELIKAVVHEIDRQVVRPDRPKRLRELRRLAAA